MKKLRTTLLLLLIAVANGQAQNWLDPQFGNAGLADAPIHTTKRGSVIFMDTAAGGKLTTFGWYENGSMHGFVVTRYLGNGSLDASFGVGGVYTLPLIPCLAPVLSIPCAPRLMERYCWRATTQAQGRFLMTISSWYV